MLPPENNAGEVAIPATAKRGVLEREPHLLRGGGDVPSNYPEPPVRSPTSSMFAVGPAIKALLAVGPSPASQDLSWKTRGIKRKRCEFSRNRDC